MFKNLFGFFTNDLSIDLGTANTLIYARDQGIVLDEPSVVAIRMHNGQNLLRQLVMKRKECLDVRPVILWQ